MLANNVKQRRGHYSHITRGNVILSHFYPSKIRKGTRFIQSNFTSSLRLATFNKVRNGVVNNNVSLISISPGTIENNQTSVFTSFLEKRPEIQREVVDNDYKLTQVHVSPLFTKDTISINNSCTISPLLKTLESITPKSNESLYQSILFSQSTNRCRTRKVYGSYHTKIFNSRHFSSGKQSTKMLSSSLKRVSSLPGTNSKSIQSKAKEYLSSAISYLISIIAKTPGVLWFYLTNPKKLKAKSGEWKLIVKKEINHYWMGSKLLIADIRTTKQIMGRTLSGEALSRRERKQLTRTASDVFRLVPMSVFVLIPFMELALPIALKIFPNMLPSTFQDSLKAEENMKRDLKSRIAMAEFFQETLQDLAKEQKKDVIKRRKAIAKNSACTDLTTKESTESLTTQEETAADFLEFIEKARKGEMFPPEVIIKYSTFFQDDLTLDNMPRMQLINMCKYMSIPPYGADSLLRFQLRHKVKSLVEDDQRILWEGIDSLTKMELREACQERGMRSTGLSKEAYKRSLQQWINLSVNRNVPISLLIMSRTFFLQEEMTSRVISDVDGSKSVAGLADAISGFDKEIVNEVVLNVATSQEKSSNPDVMQIKLEVLEQQNELIEEEKKERDANKKKAEKEKFEKEYVGQENDTMENDSIHSTKEDIFENENNEKTSTPSNVGLENLEVRPPNQFIESNESQTVHDIGKDNSLVPSRTLNAKVINEETEGSKEKNKTEFDREEDQSLSTEEIDAISQLVSPDPVSSERENLERLKAALEEEKESRMEGPMNEDKDYVDVASDTDSPKGVEILPETIVMPSRVDDGEPVEVTSSSSTQQFESIDVEKVAAETISKSEESVIREADKSTSYSTEDIQGSLPASTPTETPIQILDEAGESEYVDEKLDMAVTRLKSKIESMVGKIEIQLSDVEGKIGDKLHFLDKDMDGVISIEEMAGCLQSVLKRPLSLKDCTAIASNMDENEDGLVTVAELSRWLVNNKLVKLVEEGRDAEVDKIILSLSKMSNRKEVK